MQPKTTARITIVSPHPTTKQARAGGKRGWWRQVSHIDRAQRGAYAIVPTADPFLRDGEHDIEVGAVLVEVDCDGDASIAVVTPAGLVWPDCDPTDGGRWYYSVAKKMPTLLDAIETVQAMTLEDVVGREVARLERLAERHQLAGRAYAAEDARADLSRFRALAESMATPAAQDELPPLGEQAERLVTWLKAATRALGGSHRSGVILGLEQAIDIACTHGTLTQSQLDRLASFADALISAPTSA